MLGVQSSSSTPFLLCPSCYSKVYRELNHPQNCSSCGATPKPGQKLYRHSPNPVVVSKYITDTTGTDTVISPDEYICTSCYNTQCTIVKSTDCTPNCKPNGSDEMLQKSIKEWEATKEDSKTDHLTKAIVSSVIYVAQHLLVQKALLLPWVCQVFLDVYGIQPSEDTNTVQVTLDVGDSSVKFTSRWLLHQLITHLDGYMIHKCVHKKLGTVLYRQGGDVIVALSWALSASQPPNQYLSEPEIQCQIPDVDTTLKEASIIVNNLLHEEIKKPSHSQPSPNCALLNINTELNNINPLLLQFLTSITITVRDRETTNVTEHIKKIRLFFILNQLKFCTNPKKPTPIHDLIADVVEVCGGSRLLISILNRLGCVSSPDTHDRFVTQHAIAQRQSKIWDEIPNNRFTIASVDNFDMLQSYAAVYCGNQHRSYHGTTLQLVQPDPDNLVLPSTATSSSEGTATPSAPCNSSPPITSSSQQHASSDSHHKLGPKRPRTVEVHSLASGLTTNNTIQTSQVYMETTATTLAFNHFLQTSTELDEKNNLHDLLFSYVLQKHTLHYQASQFPSKATLCEFRFCLEDNNNCGHQHPSTIHYMELINENPDSMETMTLVLVAEDLLDKFDNVQNGYVLLVGDGKTYKHLMNIKKQYSTALQKLLIIPGDWHILKNYQPILMKIYYAAGLKEMASDAGYHGSTLKSIEQCSNFKRTHYFLMQAWEALYREMLHTYLSNSSNTITMDASCILLSSYKKRDRHNTW